MTLDGGGFAPPPFRRRPESRAPAYPELRKGRGVDSRFRGNDDEIVCFHMALAAQSDSPSPNPLPLGEGFSLGSGSGFAVMAGLGFAAMAGYRDAG